MAALAAAVAIAFPVAGWLPAGHGPAGGTIWTGRIPNSFVADRRESAVYLPPRFDPTRRYPVVYLLHGMRGSPASIYNGMQLAVAADMLIEAGAAPFIAVMPVAGPVRHPNSGEWAGIWENYVVDDVVPWVDAHLPAVPTRDARALEGLCSGGFGAIDIGLRHPALFGTLGSFDGYFAPVFRDGPFAHASPSQLLAHDPNALVNRERAALARSHTRFYVSAGGNHGRVLARWSVAFAEQLTRLKLSHELWRLPRSERGHYWQATLPSALAYADAGFVSS